MLYPSLYHRLHNQHTSIEEIIRSIDGYRMTVVPQPGKWNIHDHITHLTTYQPAFLQRVETILQQDHPSFERYVAENDPEFEKWRKTETAVLMQKLGADRAQIFEYLTHLTPQQLLRTGLHKKFGPLTIIGWTEFFLLHEAHHIFTIFQLAHDTELQEK